MNKFYPFVFCLLVLLTGCGKMGSRSDDTVPVDQLVERKDFVLTPSEREFIQENNGFALELFKKVATIAKGKSTLISPLSVTMDFGMVNNGAAGETQAEINRVLGYKGGSAEGLNAFCQSMLSQSTEVDPSTTFDVANAAIINKTFVPLKENFAKTIQSVYGAEVVYKEFGKDDVMGLINQWCAEKTRGMIPNLLTQQPQRQEYAHFLNAVYFKGIWSSQFKKSDTKNATFTLEDGSRLSIRMMWQKGKFNYGGIDNVCQTLCLPYGNQAYRMIVLLPTEGNTIEDVKRTLDAKKWATMMNQMKGYEVDVKIPVFETATDLLFLKDALIEMGIQTAFSREYADFREMTDLNEIYVNQVLHKAKITVDETGSAAAAITDIAMFSGALPGGEPYVPPVIQFHCDKPFLYAITELSSGAIYFLGQYTGK